MATWVLVELPCGHEEHAVMKSREASMAETVLARPKYSERILSLVAHSCTVCVWLPRECAVAFCAFTRRDAPLQAYNKWSWQSTNAMCRHCGASFREWKGTCETWELQHTSQEVEECCAGGVAVGSKHEFKLITNESTYIRTRNTTQHPLKQRVLWVYTVNICTILMWLLMWPTAGSHEYTLIPMILHPMTSWFGYFIFMYSIFVILSEVVPHTSVNLDIMDPWPPKLVSNVLQHHLFILRSLFLEDGGVWPHMPSFLLGWFFNCLRTHFCEHTCGC